MFPKTKVYSGLSLKEAEVNALLPFAEFSGPIERNHLLFDIDHGYQVVAIIDGHFDRRLAVSRNEVMDALRSGIRVYGSSSMGALRAAEMEVFGMIGYGKVFEHVKSASLFRDDFLGQAFCDGEVLSRPYIDFFFFLENEKKQKRISEKEYRRLLDAYANLHFLVRSQPEILRTLRTGKREEASIRRFFASKQSQKSEDARGLLKMIRVDLDRIRETNKKLLSLQESALIDRDTR